MWRDDVPVAEIDYVPSRRVIYLEADQNNTPRIGRDQSGAIIWQWNSDAFGSTAPTASTGVTVNLRFPGQYFDIESGLDYNLFRDYDAKAGRYVESDPIGLAGGVNTFGYANQNPLRFIDPNGLSGCSWVGPILVCTSGGDSGSGSIGVPELDNALPSSSSSSASSGSKTGQCPDCQALYDAINEVVFQLQQRNYALIADKYKLPPTGTMSIAGHQQQFRNVQAQLRKLLNQANAQGCKDYRSDAWGWATMPAPSPGG